MALRAPFGSLAGVKSEVTRKMLWVFGSSPIVLAPYSVLISSTGVSLFGESPWNRHDQHIY